MEGTNGINVASEELRTTREITRELNASLALLASGKLEKIVLVRGADLVGVLLSPERYAALTRG